MKFSTDNGETKIDMKDEYNITTVKDIKSFCLERYKEYTGLVIQYMFNYKRNKE